MEQNRNNMAREPIAIRTLGDMSPQSDLHAHCSACGWSNRLDVPELRRRHGALSFDSLEGRLRCSRCGRRAARLLHGWSLGAARPAP
jgi:hypothetical protein